MKRLLRNLALCAALVGASSGFGQERQQPPPAPPTLHVLISPPLGRSVQREDNLYEAVAGNFGYVFRHRKWPIAISIEEFGGRKKPDRLELELLMQPIKQWLPGELSFSAWTTLRIDQRSYDLGVIRYTYDHAPFEQPDRTFDNLIQGAANATADKIEPLLFPKGH
ncbi:MAG TPA: hypothetical protein VGL42_02115 [Opitutaceae bacterium]|jgi:hypothetical protein